MRNSSLSTTPSCDFGGNGPELLFLHANGYPPECYRPLLTRLADDYHVTAMLQRPLWPMSKPEDIQDWKPLSDDLLYYLDAHQNGPIACVGHSMGGTTLLRAALREPARFKAIVLLDPVFFRPGFIRFWRLIRNLHLVSRLHPLVATARNRRRRFDDLKRLFTGYRRKSIFRYMDDDALKAYVQGIACKTDQGDYQLCYPAEWELRIYVTGIWRDMELWRGLPRLKTPTLFIRGVETNTFLEKTAKLVKRNQPEVRIEAVDKSTHLLPLERPDHVFTLIRSFLGEIL